MWWAWTAGGVLILLLAYLGYRINRFANEQMRWMNDVFGIPNSEVTDDDNDTD